MVEPLVGHLRHPYGMTACQPEGVAVSLATQPALLHIWFDGLVISKADQHRSIMTQPQICRAYSAPCQDS